ncbi:hypothetical protein KVP06_00245 [Geobacter sulfurreducens]|uniref:RHS repeat-associated core domain-containing protein n=1 Tax=Geobacter sulfurreducens (strain ATCC 51573 / DSM 12127 / PCA) TaxID=243231 RepID=Q74H48_GEOSL|nr:RHS repeat-associated core domain-containing protein [Geobacter sulfurreducens]AAR33380.1 hypothetical protein GSU0045 [Geobacter sulfurreducens PCA]UAC04153.1 hypothetical protein KVP06_00245 [Geobacter sulfurreducens]
MGQFSISEVGHFYIAANTYFYHPDHLGGVSAVTNGSGQVVSSTSYLPFGEVRQGGTENYYTGKENDKGAGLYNFEARYVSPELRHFTQADVEEPDLDDPQDLNLYAYAGNNPLSYVDLDGYKKKKKAKLSKREKWMIAHGVDPDHDKTPLKKAKKLFKEGKKYQVAKNISRTKTQSNRMKATNNAAHETESLTNNQVPSDNNIDVNHLPDTSVFIGEYDNSLDKCVEESDDLLSAVENLPGIGDSVTGLKIIEFIKNGDYASASQALTEYAADKLTLTYEVISKLRFIYIQIRCGLFGHKAG